MNDELFYQIALTRVPGIGPVQARILLETLGSAEAVFHCKKGILERINGIGTVKAQAIHQFNHFNEVTLEIKHIEKHQIEALCIGSSNYPERLNHCYDAPTVLFYKGTNCLQNPKIVSIIGTRNNTEYGKKITEEIVEALTDYQPLIVSGLAFGIDSIAHKAALRYKIPTVGVLAHGLCTVYPSQHRFLAADMQENGGLLTEFGYDVVADKHFFPKRNRIVAGIADVTIVVETAVKGGSIITAELAYNYNRDLFAVPGKIGDSKSAGCLKLIAQNKATILSNMDYLLENMSWKSANKPAPKQLPLFMEMNEDEQLIYQLLQNGKEWHIDELYNRSGLSSSNVAAALLSLELNNAICSLPGKRYSCC